MPDDRQVKNAVAAAVRDFLTGEGFPGAIWETLEAERDLSDIEVGALTPLETTIRVKYDDDRPATYLTVQVKGHI